MAYHVQAELVSGITHYIGWFECSEILGTKFEGTIAGLWSDTILVDKKGVDGSDLRSISDDAVARTLRLKLKALR